MKKDIQLKLPSIPNFILSESEPIIKFSITDFSDAELESFGKEWTQALLSHKKEIIQNKKNEAKK